MNRIVIVVLLAYGLILSSIAQAVQYSVETAEISTEKALPALPDISGYNRAAIIKKQAKWHKPATFTLDRMINNVATRKFIAGGKLGLWATKQEQFPKALFVRNGILT